MSEPTLIEPGIAPAELIERAMRALPDIEAARAAFDELARWNDHRAELARGLLAFDLAAAGDERAEEALPAFIRPLIDAVENPARTRRLLGESVPALGERWERMRPFVVELAEASSPSDAQSLELPVESEFSSLLEQDENEDELSSDLQEEPGEPTQGAAAQKVSPPRVAPFDPHNTPRLFWLDVFGLLGDPTQGSFGPTDPFDLRTVGARERLLSFSDELQRNYESMPQAKILSGILKLIGATAKGDSLPQPSARRELLQCGLTRCFAGLSDQHHSLQGISIFNSGGTSSHACFEQALPLLFDYVAFCVREGLSTRDIDAPRLFSDFKIPA